ncbi:3182_t:CDS:2 [Diversispora eburnea]|uniref:3182_t:CDS:1 n=1 Tax=Diversispora eburnea TaxID=1213867 RepID=A0A9N9G0T8_9GLOM|nr:3182_t:CDS:2 [Diversispora eburnea]
MPSTNQPDNSNSLFSSLSSKFISLFHIDKHKIKSTNSMKSSKVSSTTVSYSSFDFKKISLKRSKSLPDDSNEIKSTNKNRRNGTIFNITIPNWIEDDDEFSEKGLIPSVLFNQNDIYELAVISKTPCKPSLKVKPIKMNNLKDSCLEGTYIVRESIEHFAYIRTLRKIRERQRPLYQNVTLNTIINKLSETDEFPKFQREELRQYKMRVYETSKKNFNSKNLNDSNYSVIKSTTTLCAPESRRIDTTTTIKNKLNAFLAECHVGSPIVTKYRPSYASTKVVTVFDDKLNQLVVRDLPLSRRKRRLKQFKYSGRGCGTISQKSSSLIVGENGGRLTLTV